MLPSSLDSAQQPIGHLTLVRGEALTIYLPGTLEGEGLGVTPTGRSMKVTGMSIVRVRNGLIVEGWNNFDVLGMHQQIGTLAQLL